MRPAFRPSLALGALPVLALGLVLAAPAAQALPHGACFMAEGAALDARPARDDVARLTLRFDLVDGHGFAIVALRFGDGARAQAEGVAGQVYDNAFFCGDGTLQLCDGEDDSGGFAFDGPAADGLRLRSDYLALIRVIEDGTDFTHVDLTDWTDPPGGWFHLAPTDPADCEGA